MTAAFIVSHDAAPGDAKAVLVAAGWSEWIPDAFGARFRLPDGTLMRVFPPGTGGEDVYVSFATTLLRAGISFQRAVVTRAEGAVYKSDRRRHLRLVGRDP